VWRSPLTEPGERFAAHVSQIAPGTDVRVLRPGETTVIGRIPWIIGSGPAPAG
jgi:hypothetical protein